jgi:hypothetical protein
VGRWTTGRCPEEGGGGGLWRLEAGGEQCGRKRFVAWPRGGHVEMVNRRLCGPNTLIVLYGIFWRFLRMTHYKKFVLLCTIEFSKSSSNPSNKFFLYL